MEGWGRRLFPVLYVCHTEVIPEGGIDDMWSIQICIGDRFNVRLDTAHSRYASWEVSVRNRDRLIGSVILYGLIIQVYIIPRFTSERVPKMLVECSATEGPFWVTTMEVVGNNTVGDNIRTHPVKKSDLQLSHPMVYTTHLRTDKLLCEEKSRRHSM